MNKVVICNISEDPFNPFEASPEELIAMALYDAGVTNDFTTLNGTPASEFLESFFQKRSRYREATRLGKILIETGKISPKSIEKALTMQKKNPDLKLGQILLQISACTEGDIEDSLNEQQRRRKPVKHKKG